MLPVNHALQGHPESPRLWGKLIHTTLLKKGFTSSAHEPCLYHGTIDDIPVYLLCQVDDFALATHTETHANKLFQFIQSHLTQEMKLLGLLTMFNGLDVDQTAKYIKVSPTTYITKILQGHG